MADNTTAKDRTPGKMRHDDRPVGHARDKSAGPARPRPPFQHPGKMDVKKKDASPDDLEKQEEGEESVRKGPIE